MNIHINAQIISGKDISINIYWLWRTEAFYRDSIRTILLSLDTIKLEIRSLHVSKILE